MSGFHDAAYNTPAVIATLALCRALIEKGILTREDAVQMLLDEAVAHAIQVEAQTQEPGVSTTTIDVNRQCAELLDEKFRCGVCIVARCLFAVSGRAPGAANSHPYV